MTKPSKPSKEFSDISDAFDYCREVDKPVIVVILFADGKSEKYKIFPSGRAEIINKSDSVEE